jgi:tRNA uridine 5-carboxymethylaminomethyl modification enzyme
MDKEPVEVARDTCYIGVMIDDLVTKDIIEPYRLFTSRAEYRLRLRQDNSDLRLSEFAYEHNLLPDNKYKVFCEYRDKLNRVEEYLKATRDKGKTLWDQLKILKGNFAKAEDLPFPAGQLELDVDSRLGRKVIRQLAITAHYEGYVNREENSIVKLRKLESWRIPVDFDYDTINGLRNESRMKLKQVAPSTLAQAERIDGVTPAEIALLQVHLTRLRKKQEDKD